MYQGKDVFLALFFKVIYYILLPMYGRENIIFKSNFSNGDFDVFTGQLNPKISFLAIGLCVCVSVCVSVISNTLRQIIAETLKFAF